MRTTNKGIVVLFTHIRQDISCALSTVIQFMIGPAKEHMEVLNRILIYLKMEPDQGLLFKRQQTEKLKFFTDAD